jgi:hypothetical protein
MSMPSYYFTLFKKLQILGHVADSPPSAHGAPGGLLGFNLNDPNSVFGSSASGTLLGASSASSPLWAMLNAGATGAGSVTIGGTTWFAMPLGAPSSISPPSVQQAWNDFQMSTPAPKLVDVLANWIDGPPGKVNDIPTGIIGALPPPIDAPPDSGVSPFVCSFAGDQGDPRPDGVPSDYWNTSLIFLVDPSSGNIVTPSTLSGGSEYYVAAVIGNRGQSAGGKYNSSGGATIQAKGIVMVWNTVFSPGVELPALSNLDITSDASLYEPYFLGPGQYDLVGFRLNVNDVFSGIIDALNTDFSAQLAAAGVTAEEWVGAQGAHLCAKVVVRQGADSFPNVGDTPLTTNKIAQKNLVPFDIPTIVEEPDPNIIWKQFIVGQPFFIRLGQGEGRNTLILEENLPREAFQLYIALTGDTFERYFGEGGGGELRGFQVVPRRELCESKLGERAKPFPGAVVLRYLGGENAIELPALGGEELLGMSLGIEYSVRRLKPGSAGRVTIVHKGLIPRLVAGTCCFEIKQIVAGGFTIEVRATDPRQALEELKRGPRRT